jgi:hypothetical protein
MVLSYGKDTIMKLQSLLACSILVLMVGTIVNCGGQGVAGSQGRQGEQGNAGSSCTVESIPEGALITCEDGSSAEVENGADGEPAPTPPPIPAPNTCFEWERCNKHNKCSTKRICLVTQ